jgi:AcrR family transcriptional regulator
MARKLDDEKRTSILAAAWRTFGDEGYQQATIKHIADAAGLAPGTVYTYFANKEELFSAAVEDIWDRFITGMHGISVGAGSFEEKLVAFLDFGFSLLVEIHPLLRGMFSEANKRELLIERVEEVCTFISTFFEDARSSGVLFGAVNDPKLQRFNLNMIVSGILFRSALAPPERLEKELATIRDGLILGIGARLRCGAL